MSTAANEYDSRSWQPLVLLLLYQNIKSNPIQIQGLPVETTEKWGKWEKLDSLLRVCNNNVLRDRCW